MTKTQVHARAALALRIGCALHLFLLTALALFLTKELDKLFNRGNFLATLNTSFDLALVLGLLVPLPLLVLYLATRFTTPPRIPGKFRWTNGIICTLWLISTLILFVVCMGSMGVGAHLG